MAKWRFRVGLEWDKSERRVTCLLLLWTGHSLTQSVVVAGWIKWFVETTVFHKSNYNHGKSSPCETSSFDSQHDHMTGGVCSVRFFNAGWVLQHRLHFLQVLRPWLTFRLDEEEQSTDMVTVCRGWGGRREQQHVLLVLLSVVFAIWYEFIDNSWWMQRETILSRIRMKIVILLFFFRKKKF